MFLVYKARFSCARQATCPRGVMQCRLYLVIKKVFMCKAGNNFVSEECYNLVAKIAEAIVTNTIRAVFLNIQVMWISYMINDIGIVFNFGCPTHTTY